MLPGLINDLAHYCNISVPFCSAMGISAISVYDFTFVLEGSMVYVVNGERILLEKNDAIFLCPGTVRGREQGDTPVRYVSFNFTSPDDCVFPFSHYMKNCITSEMRKIISAFSPTHVYNRNNMREKCESILYYILLCLLDEASTSAHNPHVAEIFSYVDQNITSPVTLSDVANHVHLSKEYVSSLFAKETGTSVTSYINAQKIHLAKELISEQKMSLTAISSYLGYESYYYFSRTFKKYAGISPMGFKKNVRT